MARILDITPAQYHADPCERPSLSSTIAKLIVGESPLHGWAAHPRLGRQKVAVDDVEEDSPDAAEDKPTKAKDDGTLVHRLMLGKGTEIAVVHADSFRTKAAREARDEARACGQLPVLAHKYDIAIAAAERLRERCAALGFHLNGASEVPVEWTDEGFDGPVLCRSMWDHVFVDDGVIYDVKKVRSANPRKCAKSFVELGYDIQHASYIRALERLRPEHTGRVKLFFLFVEFEPPYAVVPAEPDGALREIGAQRWSRAVQIWERCLARNHWPSYADDVVQLEAPRWLVDQELGMQEVQR